MRSDILPRSCSLHCPTPTRTRPREQRRPSLPRGERLTTAAERFDEVDFSRDPTFKTRILVVLGAHPEAGAIIADALAEQYEAIDFAGLAHRRNQRDIGEAMKLAALHIRNRFAEGDVEPFKKTMKSLSSHWIGNDHSYGQALSPLIAVCENSIQRHGGKLSHAEAAGVARALRDILKDRDHLWMPDRNQYLRTLILAHAIAGESAQLKKWLPTISQYYRSWFTHARLDESYWKGVQETYGKPSDENREARLKFVGNTLQLASDHAWIHRSRPWVYHLARFSNRAVLDEVHSSGLLTEKEIVQHGPEMAASLKEAPMATAALAAWLHLRKEYAAAAPLWKEIAAKTDPDSRDWMRSEWHSAWLSRSRRQTTPMARRKRSKPSCQKA